MGPIAPDEPHVHQPSNILTISEFENPDLLGIRCKWCNLDMNDIDWSAFVRFWVFERNL